MFWHPLFLGIITVDVVALILVLAAGITALRTTLDWQPLSAGSRQLSLEAKAEAAVFQGRAAFWLYLFSAFLLIFGIANVFHEDIPGAMCGTGVCQAMAPGCARLLIYTGLLLLLMQVWYELEQLNRVRVDMPLAASNARLFLVIPPVAFLALIQTVDTFASIDTHRPVDCCAVVYDQFTTLQEARTVVGLEDPLWIGTFLVLSVLLLGLGVTVNHCATAGGRVRTALGVVSLLWLPVAGLTLVNVLSAYHYGVLHHHCPWCLFLPEHNLVGYPLYGALGWIGMEGFTVLYLPRAVKEKPSVYKQSLDRCRRAGRRMVCAEILFLALALIPPCLWRLRYGVWISG